MSGSDEAETKVGSSCHFSQVSQATHSTSRGGGAEVGGGPDVEWGGAVGAEAMPAGGGDHRRVVGTQLAAREETSDPILGARRQDFLSQQ